MSLFANGVGPNKHLKQKQMYSWKRFMNCTIFQGLLRERDSTSCSSYIRFNSQHMHFDQAAVHLLLFCMYALVRHLSQTDVI